MNITKTILLIPIILHCHVFSAGCCFAKPKKDEHRSVPVSARSFNRPKGPSKSKQEIELLEHAKKQTLEILEKYKQEHAMITQQQRNKTKQNDLNDLRISYEAQTRLFLGDINIQNTNLQDYVDALSKNEIFLTNWLKCGK